MEDQNTNEVMDLNKNLHLLNADFGYTMVTVFMVYLFAFVTVLA